MHQITFCTVFCKEQGNLKTLKLSIRGVHLVMVSYVIQIHLFQVHLLIPLKTTLVSRSAGFSSVLTCPVRISCIATASQMLFNFFFKVESGNCVLWIIDMLSLYVYVGPTIVIPIIWSLYHNLYDASMHCFITTNSVPNPSLSTVAWHFVCTSHMPY